MRAIIRRHLLSHLLSLARREQANALVYALAARCGRFVARKTLIDSRPGSFEHAARTRHTSRTPTYDFNPLFTIRTAYSCRLFRIAAPISRWSRVRLVENRASYVRVAVLRAASTIRERCPCPLSVKSFIAADVAAPFSLFNSANEPRHSRIARRARWPRFDSRNQMRPRLRRRKNRSFVYGDRKSLTGSRSSALAISRSRSVISSLYSRGVLDPPR